jgi:uncharacterized membrane protein YccF (DUF307 family)
MKNRLKWLLIIIISILTIVTILTGYLFIEVLKMPYDDSDTYIYEFDIVHHDQSIIGYGTVFCLLFILTAAIIFCFRNILYQVASPKGAER